MQSKATTVERYLAELPDDRREAISAIRAVILKNLPKGCAEGMQYGMIGYCVPHSVYPAGYHCDPKQPLPFASLASQKNHMALYLMNIYGDERHHAWFTKAWTDTGKKLDMGKSCVRFRKLEDVPLAVVGEAIRRVPVKEFIATYESTLGGARQRAAGGGASTSAKKASTRSAAGTSRAVKKKAGSSSASKTSKTSKTSRGATSSAKSTSRAPRGRSTK